MWNGVGPGFNPYEKGRLARVDKMYELGFYTGHHREAEPRPSNPELRLQDLDADGVDAEFIYGILGTNLRIQDGEMAGWVFQTYNDWAVDFARRGGPDRLFPLAAIPYHDPEAAAQEPITAIAVRTPIAIKICGLKFKPSKKPKAVFLVGDWSATLAASRNLCASG